MNAASKAASPAARRASRERSRAILRYLRHPGFCTGAVILLALCVVAVTAPQLAPHPPTEADLMRTLAHPSAAHLLGTDQYGRDVLSRLIWGARISIYVALSVVVLSLTFGSILGAVAGYAGGWLDRFLMVGNDILLAFPGFLLALALVAARGSTLENVILAVAIAYTPRVAAVMRSVVITIRPRPFIEASQAIGMASFRVLWRHVLPNSLPPVIVVTTVSAATAILAEAGLSFLGLGVQPPTATWGNVISDGQGYIISNPLISVSAGLCIAITVVALNLLGDGLRDTLDPQMRRYTSSRML